MKVIDYNDRRANMYKLLCTDMDGTLLNDEKQISSEDFEALIMAHELGVKIVVCTGRLFTSAEYYSDLMGFKAPIIASNGAYIREKDRNEVVYKSTLGYNNCRLCLDVSRKHGLYPHFYTADAIFTDEIIYSSKSYAKFNELLPEGNKINIVVVKDWEEIFKSYKEDILKFGVIDEDAEKVAQAKKEISANETIEVVTSLENNFEVMSKGVSKGRAVEILAAFYGIKREEIICIGDNENDLSMLKYAGLGIAMGNSAEYIKQYAAYTTDTNNNHGVAKAVRKFILNNKV